MSESLVRLNRRRRSFMLSSPSPAKGKTTLIRCKRRDRFYYYYYTAANRVINVNRLVSRNIRYRCGSGEGVSG